MNKIKKFIIKKPVLSAAITIVLILLTIVFWTFFNARISSAAWYNSSWSYRKELVFNNIDSTTNLTDFAVMVKLTTSNFNFSQAQSAGQDIRFTDSDGTTLLDYEIEAYDSANSTATIWVKVPQIDATSTTDSIFVYWGNGSATDAQSADNTWNSNYKGVYHLNDNAANTTVTDSSGLTNNITSNENTAAINYIAAGQNAGAFLTAGNPMNIQHYPSVLTEQLTDIALDSNNHPVVAFYDSNGGNLNITHCNDRNCKGGDESVTSPATSGAQGQYPSLKLDSNGYPVIAHYDATNFDLILTRCNDVNCVGVETSTVVDNSVTTVGLYPSLTLDSSGFPVIAYYDSTTTALKIVHCDDLYCAGGDTPVMLDGSGADNVGGLQQGISVTVDSSDFPVVAYYDNTNTDLKFVHCNDVNCAGETPVALVASVPNDTGRYVDVVLDGSGFPVLTYEDWTNRDTYLIHCNDIDCLSETPELIDATLADYPTLKLNGSGYPVVVYSSNLVFTRVAVCDNAACTTDVQQNLSSYNQYGSYLPAVAIASDGALAIANYHRGKYDGFYDVNIITTDHKLDRAYDSDFDFGTGSFSFSAWFKTQGQNKSQQNTILSRYDTDQGFKAYLDHSGQPCIAIDDDATWGPDDSACSLPSSYYTNVDNGYASNPLYLSMVLDANSYPVIAYYDATSTDLELIHCNDVNCSGGNENFASLETANTAGQFTSIVLDSNGYPVISYYTVGSGIKVIHCGDANCSTGNNANVVDGTATTSTMTSLHLDGSGNPVVAYYQSTGGDLKLSHCSNPNCTATTTVTIDSTGSIVAYPSLELDGSGFPVISYQDNTSTSLDLKLVHCGDANCSAGNTINSVATTGQTGYYTDMELDSNGYPVIAYYYNNTFELMVTHCNDVNCAGNDENNNSAFSNFDGGNNWMTIKLNNSGYPVILHTSLGFHTQILTTCNDVNCAGDDETHNYIREEVHNISHGSLALDSSGFPVVVTRSGNLDVSITRPGTATYTNTNTVDDGAWHHLVGVKNGTTSLTLYIDGVAVATDSSIAATGTLTSNSATLNLAEDIVGGFSINGLDGYLDEVQIDNTARSADWVKAQYLSESNNFINVSFTQYGFIANKLSGFTNNTGAIKNNLVAHYKFDEGFGTVANNSGSGGSTLNGTITGTTWSNDGKFAKAVNFVGGTDSIAVSSISGIKSVSFWVNPTTTTQSLVALTAGIYVSASSGTISATGFTSPTIYVNGKVSTTLTANVWQHIIVTSATPVTASAITLGRANGSSLTGKLDDVKLYTAELTTDEIKLDYNKNSSIQLGAFSDTSLLTGGSVASSSATAQYCVPGSSDPCSAPIGEWKMEENSGQYLYDTSGNNNTAFVGDTASVASNDPTWTTGKTGGGLEFDGIDDTVKITDNDLLTFGNGTTDSPLTMELWVNVPDNISHYFFSKSAEYRMRLGSDGRLICTLSDSSTGGQIGRSYSPAFPENSWQHIVCTYDGSGTSAGVKIYQNGIRVDNGNETSGTYVAMENTSNSLYMTSTPDTAVGKRDNFQLFNYERTPAQVAWDYNQGKPIAHWKLDECTGTTANDSSGNTNTGAITIGATGTNTSAGTCVGSAGEAWKDGATGKYNSSLELDGTDDYITASSFNGKSESNFTAAAWVKTTDAGGRLFSHQNSPNLWIVYVGAQLGYQGSDDGAVLTSFGPTINDDTWHHVAITRNLANTTVTYYVDGKEVGTLASGTNTYTIAASLYIGAHNGTTQLLYGQIDDARIYNYALTPAQIKMVYNEGSAVRFGP
jgi:hypothetical protein